MKKKKKDNKEEEEGWRERARPSARERGGTAAATKTRWQGRVSPCSASSPACRERDFLFVLGP